MDTSTSIYSHNVLILAFVKSRNLPNTFKTFVLILSTLFQQNFKVFLYLHINIYQLHPQNIEVILETFTTSGSVSFMNIKCKFSHCHIPPKQKYSCRIIMLYYNYIFYSKIWQQITNPSFMHNYYICFKINHHNDNFCISIFSQYD